MAKAKILVIEDEKSIRRVLTEVVKRSDYEVLSAGDGEAGLAMALSEKPDLILLDILMPKMDGETMLTKLREDEWGNKVPVIMMTNFDAPEQINESMQKGVAQYLVKANTSSKELIQAIEQVLAG